MPDYDLSKYYDLPDYKYASEEDVPQTSIQKYISERNKLKSPDTGFINPESDTELRDAMLRGDFDVAEVPTYDLSAYYDKESRPEPSFMDDLSGALSSGYRNMKAGLAGTGVISGIVGKEEAAASFVESMKNQPETPEYYERFLDKFEAEGKDVIEAEGIWDTTIESLDLVGEAMLEAVTNPKGLAYTITESLAQSLPAIGLGGAGALGGSLVAPVAGTIAGLAAGTSLGTFAVEAGGHLKGLVVDNLREQGRSIKDVNEQDIINVFEDPTFMDWAESEASKRGLAVAAVEGLFAAFGGKILAGAAGKSIFSKVVRGAADVGVESIGEATGELAGQLVTEGDIDPGGIAMEGIAGLGQSVGTSLTGAAVRAPINAAKPKDDLDNLFGDGVDDIPGDALDNLNAEPVLTPEAEPTITPTNFEQETASAMELINSYDDLTDAYAGYQQDGMLDQSIAGAIYEDALNTPHPQRTDGQKALVEMGRKSEQAAMSPIEKMRNQSEEAVEIPIPEATPEEKATIPEALKGASDVIEEITDEQITEDITTEAPAPLEKVRPVDEGLIPTEQPSGAVVQAEEPTSLAPPERSVAEIESEISDLETQKPKGIPAVKEWQKQLGDLGTQRDAAVKVEVDIAANQAATSELNVLPEPNEEQAKAGNYKKGLLDLNGFGIAIENPKGSTRSGVDAQGKEWSTEMKDHYGEIQNTEGADGDNVDVFIGDSPESQKVFVVDQIDPTTGKFDEHKVIMGTNDAKQAKRTYNRNYAKGWKGDGAITEMSVDEFRTWVNFGDTTKPITFEEVTTDAQLTDDKIPRDAEVSTTAAPDSTAGPTDVKPKKEDIASRRKANREGKPSKKLPLPKAKAVRAKVQAAPTTTAPVEATQSEPAVIVRPKIKDFETRDTFTVPAGTTLGIGAKKLATQNFDKVINDDGYVTYTRKTDEPTPTPAAERAEVPTKDITKGDLDVSDYISVDTRTTRRADQEAKRERKEISDRDIRTPTPEADDGIRAGEASTSLEAETDPGRGARAGKTEPRRGDDIAAGDGTPVAAPTEDRVVPPVELRDGEPAEITAKELVPEPSPLAEVIKKRDVTGVADFIRTRTEVPALRAVLERIRDNVPMNVKIKLIKLDDKDPTNGDIINARALFNPNEHTIYIKDDSFVQNGMRDETVIHEILHAVTSDLLRVGEIKTTRDTGLNRAVKDLEVLRDAVVMEINRKVEAGWRPKGTVMYSAMQNVDEFISYGLTNPEFQDILKSIPMDNGSLWSNFVATIANMLGIPEGSHNALSELMVATDNLLDEDFRIEAELLQQVSDVRSSSSYKIANKSVLKQAELTLLEDQVTALEFDVSTKSDIQAGKKLREAQVRANVLKEEIQEQRADDPYFEVGTDDIDAQGDALMGKPTSRMTLRERLKSFFDGLKVMGGDIPNILGRIVSSAYVIEAQERKTHGSRLTAEDSMTAAVHKSWNSKVAASMAIHEHGVSMENGTIVPDTTKPGLSQILEGVAQHGERYLRRFEQYLLLQRSKELMTQDRENFVTQENIDLMDSWLDRNPNTKALFEAQHRAFQVWNKGTLDIAIASGWINKQDAYGGFMAFDADGNEVFNAGKTLFETEADALEAGVKAEAVEGWYSDMYVPFYRIADDKGTRTPGTSKRTAGDVAKAVTKLKGGEGQIPILENIVKNAEFIINGSMRTIAMQKIETEFSDTVMEEMDGVEVPGLIDAATMREEYRNLQEEAALDGEPVPKMGQADQKRWSQMKSFARPTDSSTVVVYRDGRPKYYKVLDERLLTALKSIGAPRAKNWLQIIGMPTRLLQKSITVMPAFLARSFTRELQNAFIINRKGGANPLKTLGKGLKNFAKIATGDKAWMGEMMTGGFVNYNTYYNVTPDKLRNKLDKVGIKRSTFKNIVLAPWESAKSLGRIYMQIAVASEHASRKTVYDDFIKAGASKEEAMYQALDTMNFSRRSDYAAMEVLLATIPFLNPRIQGLDRLVRGAKEDWKPFALKAGLMASSAIALSLFNWEENEDEMNALKDEDKAMNYHIFLDLGGETKEHWRIPKGFEVGQITGTLPEFFVEQLYADQAEPASKALRRFMTTTFGLQIPQAVAPMLALGFNEDPFRQRPIINYGQQFLLPNAQFDAWTSKLIVDISQSMPDSAPDWLRSPKKFEYLIKGYTGSLGAMVLEGVDDIYRMTGNAPDLPTKKASELYLVRDFYRTGSIASSKQIELFYSMVQETGKLASTLKMAKEASREEYRNIRVDNAAKLRARSALNKYSKRMSGMSAQLRRIMQSDLSPSGKQQRKDALTKRKNALAKKAVDRYWYIFE